MRLAATATACLVALLVACAGTDFSWDQARQVKAGMPEKDVVALLGPPNSVRAGPDGQVWVWVHVNGMTASTRTLSLVMRDGVVTSAPQIPDSFK